MTAVFYEKGVSLMRFRTVRELTEVAQTLKIPISEVMIRHEEEVMNRPRAEIVEEMGKIWM